MYSKEYVDPSILNSLAEAGKDPVIQLYWVFSAMLVFLMQIGFTLLETGCVRRRNMWGIAVKNFMIFLSASVVYSTIGFQLMYGRSFNGWVGIPFSVEIKPEILPFLLYQTGFASVTSTIISGAIAERTHLRSNVIIATFVAGIIFPIHGHWVWGGGFLYNKCYDFAGSSAVHFLGGMVAFFSAIMVGRRDDRRVKNGKLVPEPRHLAIVVCGVFFLWIGWIGFNGGSIHLPENLPRLTDIGKLVLNTCTAASAGGFAVICLVYYDHRRHEKVKKSRPNITVVDYGDSFCPPFDSFATERKLNNFLI